MYEGKKMITISDILKSEADPSSRTVISAPKDTKMGQPVKYELRGQYVIALPNESNGKVLIQPHNCIVNLEYVKNSDITSVMTGDENNIPLSIETLKKEGDAYGIQYIDKAK